MSGFSFALKKAKAVSAFGDDSSSDDEAPVQQQEAKRQRTAEAGAGAAAGGAALPPPPSDPAVRNAVEKLASFVAANGRGIEDMTRERNPGDTVFKFLHDKACADYRYFDSLVRQAASTGAGQAPAAAAAAQAPPPCSSAPAAAAPRRRFSEQPAAPQQQQPQVPRPVLGSVREVAEGAEGRAAAAAVQSGDSLAAMDAYAKLVERRDESRGEVERREAFLNETACDRRRTTAVFKEDGQRGHHMGDFIPKEQLAALLARAPGGAERAAAEQLEAKSKIGADNIGHKLLQKMGWKDGEGLGASASGIAAPVSASGALGQDKTGLGAGAAAASAAPLDPFEAYKQRMALGYEYRANPLGNPRKKYTK